MNRLLGTVAVTLLFATPALAQQSPYDTNPTPQERAQTNQLNTDAAAEARTPPAAAHRWYVLYGYDDRRSIDRMDGSDLMGLRVITQNGAHIGHIRGVDADGQGRIVRVRVATGEQTAAWIDADDLRYNPATGAVLTDLSKGEVDGLPHTGL